MEPRAIGPLARTTRQSSRRSSPRVPPTKDSPAPTAEDSEPVKKPKTYLEKWLEPPLAEPVPSYMEYKGLEKTSVLENMLPLGTMPPMRLKSKGRSEPPLKKLIISTKNGTSTPKEEPAKTPTMSTRMQSQRRSEAPASLSPAAPSSPEMPKAASRSEAKKSPTKLSSTIADPPGVKLSAAQETYKQICEAACIKALAEKDYDTLETLRVFFLDTYEEEQLVQNLRQVLLGSVQNPPNPQLCKQFRHYMRKAHKSVQASKSSFQSPKKKISSSNPSSTRPERSSAAAMITRLGASRSSEAAAAAPHSLDLKSRAKSSPRTNINNNKPTEDMLAKDFKSTLQRSLRSKSNSSAASSLTSLESAEIEEPHGFGRAAAASPGLPPTSGEQRPSTTNGASSPILATTRTRNSTAAASKSSPTRAAPPLHTFSTSAKKAVVDDSHQKQSLESGVVDEQDEEEADEDEVFEAIHRRLLKPVDMSKEYELSNLRDPLAGDEENPTALPPAKSTRSSLPRSSKRNPTFQQPTLQPSGLGIGKRKREEDELLQSDAIEEAVEAKPPSRPETPTAAGRPSKRAKKTPRVKTSPMKKKTGTIAGTSRAPRVNESPTDSKDDENNDYCSACSGTGQLLCCDGCDRSFHMTCIDPPIDAAALPDEWFCFICLAKKEGLLRSEGGLFASLFSDLHKENPAAFELPVKVRNYFEGVKTGDEGEYEETVYQKPRTRAGYEEAPDHLKLKDNKGKYVLCYKCGKSSLNQNEIINCDFCSLHWHLDCLDPPRAAPPQRVANGKVKTWMCPNHIDKELLAVDPNLRRRALTPSSGQEAIGHRTHRVRRPKNVKVVQPVVSRGMRNNGLIEILNEPSDEEDFSEQLEYGSIYRLPENTLKLDFINKMHKRQEMEEHAEAYRSRLMEKRAEQFARASEEIRAEARAKAQEMAPAIIEEEQHRAAAKANYEQRPFVERQLALNLTQLSSQDAAAGSRATTTMGVDAAESLIMALTAEAPAEVRALMVDNSVSASAASSSSSAATATAATASTAIPPSPPSSESRPEVNDGPLSDKEKNLLLLLQDLIAKRLEKSAAAESVTLPL